MNYGKFEVADEAGTYRVTSVVTENDILEMAKNLARKRLAKGRLINSPKVACSYLQALLSDYEHEVFGVLFLDNKHKVICFEELFRGTINAASVYPREVVKRALQVNAVAVILVHNHPSGDPTPSDADKQITNRLRDALSLVDIKTLDHVVVCADENYSLSSHGLM